MEALQSYGLYFIVLGGLLIVAGLIMGYMTTLPSETSAINIPPREQPSESVVVNVPTSEKSSVSNVTIGQQQTPYPAQENTSITSSMNIDVIDKLDRLTRLREQGVISVEQYEALRKQLLDS